MRINFSYAATLGCMFNRSFIPTFSEEETLDETLEYIQRYLDKEDFYILNGFSRYDYDEVSVYELLKMSQITLSLEYNGLTAHFTNKWEKVADILSSIRYSLLKDEYIETLSDTETEECLNQCGIRYYKGISYLDKEVLLIKVDTIEEIFNFINFINFSLIDEFITNTYEPEYISENFSYIK